MRNEKEIDHMIDKLSKILQNSPAGNPFTLRRLALFDTLMWVKGGDGYLTKGDIE